MTRPTGRVLALLEILQRGGAHTAAELAAELAVDERTVRRYVGHLIEIDVPVTSVRGRYGGYRLAAGERMPPLMLTEDEALAVLLGLLSGEHSGLAGGASAAEAAARKVRGALPEASARRLAVLMESASFTGPEARRAAGRPEAAAEARVLLLLASAVRERRPLWFQYTSRDGSGTDRTLLPYGVVAHAGRWYATGLDSLSGQLRTFRLDRMLNPSLLPGEFDVPAGFDPVDAVLDSLAKTPWANEVSVLVRGAVDDVRAALRPGLGTVEDAGTMRPGEEWCRVRLQAERLDWVPGLFAGLNRAFVVESPDELRDRVRMLGHRLLDAASHQPAQDVREKPLGPRFQASDRETRRNKH